MLRAFQWDLARQVERLDVLLELLPRYASWGYQELYLHLEDAVDYPSLPGVARDHAYSWRELETLVRAAKKVGIGVVPIVNLLGHTQYLIKTERWRDLNELREADGSPKPAGQLCPLHPETSEVMSRLLRDTAPLCTAGKLHVGLDESFHLGKCPRCAAEVKRHGLATHFARHAGRVHKEVSKYGLQMGIWADMLALLPEAIPQLPRGIAAYDWYYYPFEKRPRIEFHNYREYDLAPALRRQGIDYWGCPMNGAFRFEPLPIFGDRLDNIRSWWKRCHDTGAKGMLVTSWEAYRLAFELPAVVDAAAAGLWLDAKPGDNARLLSRGFARLYGRNGARNAAKTALEADKYPFSGYYAWESNQRWDGGVTVDNADRLRRECRALAFLARRDSPEPLQSSLALRFYFAFRARFICSAAAFVEKLRNVGNPAHTLARALADAETFTKALEIALEATSHLWERTRQSTWKNQNLEILRTDARRLHAWLDWIEAVQKSPLLSTEACPVFGRWRLSFDVENFEPAVQKTIVEQQGEDGSWKELAARHTIEFQASAAARMLKRVRPFAVPLESVEKPVRIDVRGVGRARIKNVRISNGVTTERLSVAGKTSLVLGKKAPSRGMPVL